MAFCGQQSLVVNCSDHTRASRLKCRSWGCPECFGRRLRQLRDLASAGYPDAFLTLTTRRGSYDSPDEAARAMVKALRHLLQWIRRSEGWDRIPYLAIFEQHKSGWPHLHVLLRMPYVPQAELSAEWYRLTGSPIVHITRIKSQRHASRYVAKYASKGPGAFDGTKRYWRSQSYVLDLELGCPKKAVHDGECNRSRDSLEALAWWFEQTGWHVGWESDDHWEAVPLPCQGGSDARGPPPPEIPRAPRE